MNNSGIPKCHLLAGIWFSDTNPVIYAFPLGPTLQGNIPYSNDNLPKHLVDIYLPPNSKGKLPLVILIHDGGWLHTDIQIAEIRQKQNLIKQ